MRQGRHKRRRIRPRIESRRMNAVKNNNILAVEEREEEEDVFCGSSLMLSDQKLGIQDECS